MQPKAFYASYIRVLDIKLAVGSSHEHAKAWHLISVLTRNSSSVAEVDGVPNHRSVGNRQQGLGVLIWVRGESRE